MVLATMNYVMVFDKSIVFICATGARAGEAYDTVKMIDENREVFFLDATVTFLGEGKYELESNVWLLLIVLKRRPSGRLFCDS